MNEGIFPKCTIPIDIREQARRFRDQIALTSDEVFDFFICFSKFECSLKQAGYTKPSNQDWITPDWIAFAIDIAPVFDNQDAGQRGKLLNDAIEYFQNNPPQKQVLRDGQIVFEKTICCRAYRINLRY